MIRSLITVLLVVASSSCILGDRLLYRGFHVIKATTDKPQLVQFLVEDNQPNQIDVWGEDKDDDGQLVITFHIHPSRVEDVTRTLRIRGVKFQVLSSDLQSVIDQNEKLSAAARRADDPFSFYYDFEELQVFLTEQVARCGDKCELIKIGESFQGRPLNVIKLVGEPTPGCKQKPSIWIDAGIHAREWIAVSTGQFLINRLIEEYDTNAFIKEIRDIYDWYILPSVNPDGYSYSWTTERLWRKTRQNYTGTECIGTDANRNFDFHWMTIGASSDPCSATYAGPYANSEPEAVAQSKFILSRNGTWDLFITLHTYGQLWMAPYGYTKTRPENYDSLAKVGLAAVQTIAETSGEVYRFGSAADILYQSSGTSRDWAAGVPKIPFVYTIELRNKNSFILPPSQIRPTGEEIWAALKTTVNLIRQERPGVCVDERKV